ncbi:acyltransferase domain-containing protein [Cellulomonas marina]|uniref:GNAT-like C-terminal domain-containing protein n=1 Tax=Cellulomonas marina TaxID=988821 RepID=A0A1I0XAI8_9CELL|nr:acyltransferase domain-containing protein [Cellulomonas marina]SFA97360.1 hypothetical protein SAMN05421867_104210 [Cellulomonas marina]
MSSDVTEDGPPTDGAAVLGVAGVPWAAAPADPALVERLREALTTDGPPDPAGLPRARTLVPALVALVPDALERFRSLGLPADVARATLSDVGRKVAVHDDDVPPSWLLGLLRADVVALGRLQVERVAVDGERPVHVPQTGPLLPAEVDRSLAWARDLLGDERFVVTSWLLDPTFTALGPTSNIVRFAARFDAEPVPDDAPVDAAGFTAEDRSVTRFTVQRSPEEVLGPEFVPRTRLEHLLVDHLGAGRHFVGPHGVLRDPAPR